MYYLLIVLLLLAAYWLLRNLFPPRHRPKLGDAKPAQQGKDHPYRAVSIRSYSDRCEAVRAVKGKRFLSAESPPLLPLDGCTSGDCHCVYVHHVDRRSGNGGRRLLAMGGNYQVISGQSNRRQGTGRRASDRDDFALA